MCKWLAALSILLTAATAVSAPAWTWVDENGRRHFSDRPVPGATQIELRETQSFGNATPPPAAQAGSSSAAPAESSPEATVPYRVFNITSPVHQQTLWNIGGNLSMTVDLQPALQGPHRLDAILDGQLVEIDSRSPELTVPDVFRGMHTLQAVVVDEAGNEVLRSRAITIMVQQSSILNPNNPNRPGNSNNASR
jgi:Domain of unknown function (DUF4124)